MSGVTHLSRNATARQMARQCHHRRDVPLMQTLLYCLSLSSFFVVSLYAFVPSSVRRLRRDHVRHIKWRAGVVLGVMMSGVGLYRCTWIVCRIADDRLLVPPWYAYIGMPWQPLQDLQIALHVVILYSGSFVCSWLKIYHNARILHREKETAASKRGGSLKASFVPDTRPMPILPKPKYLRLSLKYTWIQPTIQSFRSFHDDEDHRWIMLRNLCIAPAAEELIFRSCLLPPLLTSRPRLSPTQASWIAPLFFGVAHLHHFYEKYRVLPSCQRSKGEIGHLLLGLAVQWTYTTLFGAFASHVFVRTGSLLGVILAHVICNYMGLPDIGFSHKSSSLHRYRWLVMTVYFFGISLFILGFDFAFYPKESVLPSLLLRGTKNEIDEI